VNFLASEFVGVSTAAAVEKPFEEHLAKDSSTDPDSDSYTSAVVISFRIFYSSVFWFIAQGNLEGGVYFLKKAVFC
jgi:hypothetical protein